MNISKLLCLVTSCIAIGTLSLSAMEQRAEMVNSATQTEETRKNGDLENLKNEIKILIKKGKERHVFDNDNANLWACNFVLDNVLSVVIEELQKDSIGKNYKYVDNFGSKWSVSTRSFCATPSAMESVHVNLEIHKQ